MKALLIAWAFALVSVTNVFAQPAQSPVERGSYLVNTILTCGNCHTPRGPGGVFDMSKQLSGGPQVWDEPTFTVRGVNITPDPETGIGKWSDADIKRALLTGVRPDGRQLAPLMPYGFYKVFTPSDIDAVVAYLRSIPPVRNAVEASVYRAPMRATSPPGADKPMTEADMNTPVKRGFYLVTIGHCMECHTPMGPNGNDFSRLGTGGQVFKGPWGVSVSRNITSDPKVGLGAWTDAQIKAAITKGEHNDGSKLRPPMGYPLYAAMSERDLDAMVAYLRTVPAKQ